MDIKENKQNAFNRSEHMKKLWRNPEYRRKQQKSHSEASKKMWQDPKYRERMIEVKKEMWKDEAYREHMSEALKKYASENREKRSEITKNTWKDPEIRRRRISGVSKALKGSKIHAQLTRERNKRKWQDANYRKHMSVAHKARWQDPEFREKTGVAISKALKNKWATDENMEPFREKLSQLMKDRFSDDKTVVVYVTRMRAKCHVRPNKAEVKLQKILDRKFPGQYQYVGDWKLIIGRKNPDFINLRDNKIIELFGRYWHQENDTEKRIAYFAERGFQTLIIWEDELNDLTALENKLDYFQAM